MTTEGEPARRALAEEYPQWEFWRTGDIMHAWLPDPAGQVKFAETSWTAIGVMLLGAEFGDWEVFAGVSGLVYARLPKTSLPVVLRDETVPGLRAQVLAYLNGK